MHTHIALPHASEVIDKNGCRKQKDGRRIMYSVCEYEPLLDSSNMTYDDYARLATDIEVSFTVLSTVIILVEVYSFSS